ncbi:hypothetical protein BpHYR1_021198 [Brachionus plicatilis]|uniref:Uncharacterized protein n=1 Tax=Brachionus plicatilis TaxID=10195 RepID=A0A3M7TAZ9_BRAPC|nr:hypothetical protein BpHYR1_021198 [Brachionus plicatilis]
MFNFYNSGQLRVDQSHSYQPNPRIKRKKEEIVDFVWFFRRLWAQNRIIKNQLKNYQPSITLGPRLNCIYLELDPIFLQRCIKGLCVNMVAKFEKLLYLLHFKRYFLKEYVNIKNSYRGNE